MGDIVFKNLNGMTFNMTPAKDIIFSAKVINHLLFEGRNFNDEKNWFKSKPYFLRIVND